MMYRDDKPREERRPMPAEPAIVDDHRSMFREPRKDWRIGVTLESVLRANLRKVDPEVTVTPANGAYEIMLTKHVDYDKMNKRLEGVIKHYIGFLPSQFEVERMEGGYRIII